MLTINLLPPEEKYKVRLGRKRRIIVFFGVLSSAVWILGAVLLAPSYLFSGVHARALADALVLEETSAQQSRLHETLSALRRSSAQVAAVKEFAGERRNAGDLLENFLRAAPGIAIETVTITKNGAVAVNGIAATRADLLLFESALRNSNALESMSIPLSSIIRESNIRFNVQGTLNADNRL